MTALDLADDPRSVASFARRAFTHDADSVVRVVARGDRVAFFVRTAFETLAMRAAALREHATFDLVVEAAMLVAQARSAKGSVLELPPALPALRWTSGMPPTGGWAEITRLPSVAVVNEVESAIAEFRDRVGELPEDARSQAALESLAHRIWDRPLVADVPLRLAHTAQSYGFFAESGEIRIFSAGAWRRLDATYGTVLGRDRTTVDLLGL